MHELKYKKTDSVQLSDDRTSVVIIDQTLLPNKLEYLTLTKADEMYEAIKQLRVRGAPAIGIFAAYAMAVLSKSIPSGSGFMAELERLGEYLVSSRPTAVNLSWAVSRQLALAKTLPPEAVPEALLDEAVKIHLDDISTCMAIAEYGLSLLHEGDTVLTHCNAGALATSRYGTGLGALLLGAERGIKLKAFVDETRPLLQGARLTAYELKNAGVDVSLICDNMAAYFMSKGMINAVFVGCDRVAANGDTANKIGTLGAAVAAKHFGVPFYVCCPTSTIDINCKSGDDIVIEERDGSEVAELYYAQRMAPEGIICRSPAFDVTPSELITAIITERGILRGPYDLKTI